MSTIRRALSNTFYLFGDWIVIMVLGYIFWIVLTKLLTASDVGIFSLISNVAISLTTITALGYNVSATRIVSEKISNKQDVGGTNRYFLKTSLAANLMMAVTVVLFFGFFNIKSVGFLESLAIAGYLVLNSIYNVSMGILQGMQDMRKVFSTDLLDYVLKLTLTIILVVVGLRYFGPIIAYIIATLIALFFRLSGINFTGNHVDKSEVWKYSVPTMLGSLGLMLFFQSNVIILGSFRAIAEVGIFTLSFMITTPIRAVYQSISSAIFPIATGQWFSEKKENVAELLSRSIRYTLVLALPALVIIFLFSSEILLIFTTQEYLAGANSMRIISLGSLLSGLALLFGTILFSAGRPKENRNVHLIGGIFNTLLCFALIPIFGINGASISFFLGSLTAFLLSFYWYKKFVKVKLKADYFPKILLAVTIFFAFSYGMKIFLEPVQSLIATSILGLTLYFATLIVMRFFDEYDLKLIESIEEKFPKNKNIFRYMKKLIYFGAIKNSKVPK